MTTAAYAASLLSCAAALALFTCAAESIVDRLLRLLARLHRGVEVKRPRVKSDERDLFSWFGRQYMGWQRGERKRIRRRVAKRERREAVTAIARDPESA